MEKVVATRVGRYMNTVAGGETVRAYVPTSLPPNPPVNLLPLLGSLSAAERAMGRLDGISVLLPSHELFLYMYVRKEAVLSSQIEGTQSTLTDLLRFEADEHQVRGEPDDIREVSNYVSALMYGMERMQSLPISLRLIREMHTRLLSSGRGAAQDPGEFRRTQNWVGGTRPGNALYVPPPISKLGEALGSFERFLHEEASGLPPLIKAGLLHVQFETIHPFLDGNGRLGRLLITLYLCKEGVLQLPLLYLSLYLKTHRSTYYQLLQDVRERGDWESWLRFFLEGVAETANGAFQAANRIVALFKQDRERIVSTGARAGSVLRVHEMLQHFPLTDASRVSVRTQLAMPTVNVALNDLERLGIVAELTGRKRDRQFAYKAYLDILSEGTAPLGRQEL